LKYPSIGRARLAPLLACLSFCAAAAAAETVVVTGAREPLSLPRLVADVDVIDADTLRDTRADSLADLLRRESGLQVSRSGGPGQSTGLFIRGAASQQSIVLVDGVRVGSATLGYAAAESLGLAPLERVEVLRGPASGVYGADAVGGVVNLITKAGQGAAQWDGRLAVGGYGSREGSAGVRGSLGAWDYAATLADERTRGVSALRPGDAFGNYNPDRDGYRLSTAQGRLGFAPAAGQRVGLLLLTTKLNSQYDSSEFLPPNFVQDASPDFRTKVRTEVAALDWRGALAAGLTGTARVSRSVDDANNGGNELSHFRTVREQLGAQLAWQSGVAGQWVLGLEEQHDRADSSSYLSQATRRNRAVVVESTGSTGPWAWQGNLRRDDSSDFGGVTSAQLGGSAVLMPGLRLRTLLGNTFRAPSFNDLVFPGYGVPGLRPERGRSGEIGLVWRPGAAGTSEAALTLYRNRVRNLIGYQSDPASCPADPAYAFGCAGNINRALLEGLTLGVRQRLGAWLLRAQLDGLHARDETTQHPLDRRASRQATLGADWSGGAWTAGGSLRYLGSRPDGGKELAAETTLDLSASWKSATAWSLQAKLLNATNRSTEPARDYQGLGRQAWLVLRYEPTP
jgi:vitamin B12 transporter